MRARCGIKFPEVFQAFFASHAAKICDLKAQRSLPATRQVRLYHHLDDCHHVHKFRFVPHAIIRARAMRMRYTGHGQYRVVIVPDLVIRAAQERDTLADRLFVLWAIEQNARALARLLRTHRRNDPSRALVRGARRLKMIRQRLEQMCCDSLRLPRGRNHYIVPERARISQTKE